MTQLLPPKKDVALALLERSNVDVYLDPRSKGVVVPPQFRREPRLILKIGLNMPVPIPDLRLDDDSMSCTLSFNRAKFFCVVPWPSVFAMVGDDGRGMVWPDDVPQELAVRIAEETTTGAPTEGEPAAAAPASSGPKRGRANGTSPAAGANGASGSNGAARRPKRTRKKKDEPRKPVLVAVPPIDTAAPEPVSAPRAETAEKEAPRDGVSPVRRAPQPPRTGAKPKRELPPYLRVVK